MANNANTGSLLPAGYLSTNGNQIIDSSGDSVRIDSIGWSGTDSLTFAPYGLWQSSLQQNIDGIKAAGFNTIRIPWSDLLLTASPELRPGYAAFNPALDPELVGKPSLQLLDVLVADAAKDGLKVIFDHHDNDGGPLGWGGQQTNGLWFDKGPGSDETDGSGTTGTITAAQFLTDSVVLAQRYAGNATVIGFDLHNEPNSSCNITWGGGGPADIHAMYTQVGNAIQAVDPGALIIAEGPEEWSGPAAGLPAGFGEGDLSGVATLPVALQTANKVVYSVHEYPPGLAGNGSYDPAQQIAAMNRGWGYLETGNIAPVLIGEIGSNNTIPADQAWIQTVIDYANGKDGAQGGPTFAGNAQPVSASWWQWGNAPGQDPQGIETAWGSNNLWPAQQASTAQLAYTPTGVAGVSVGSGPDSVVLQVSEDAWRGNAQFTVSVDGQQQGGALSAIASHAAGRSQAVTLLGSFGAGPHTVGVDLINDAYGGSSSTDRNLYVDSIGYGGATVAFGAAQWGGGTATYALAGTAPIVSGTDSIVLQVAEDAWQGDAQFTVSIDGVQQGGTLVATASHAAGTNQAVTLLGSFGAGPNTVAIDFINDAYGGSASTDRNLYVDSITSAGQTTALHRAQFWGGVMEYQIARSVAASGAVASPTQAPQSSVTSGIYISAAGAMTLNGIAHPELGVSVGN